MSIEMKPKAVNPEGELDLSQIDRLAVCKTVEAKTLEYHGVI